MRVQHNNQPAADERDETITIAITFASDLSQEVALVVEDLDAVGAVVADEDLLPVVHHHAVGELEMLGAAKLVQDVAHLIKYNHTHDLKNYHLNGKKIVRCHTGAVFCPFYGGWTINRML